jgi:hypothetical protein
LARQKCQMPSRESLGSGRSSLPELLNASENQS